MPTQQKMNATWPEGETITAEPQASNTFIYRHAINQDGHELGQIYRRLDDGLWHVGVFDVTNSAVTWDELSTPSNGETNVRVELLAVPPSLH